MDMDLFSGVTVTEGALNISRTANLTGTAIDTQQFEGKWSAILSAGAATAGSSPTLDVVIKSSTASGGSYATITDASFTQVTDTASTQIVGIDKKSHDRYVKVYGTLGGTSTPTFPYGVAFVSRAKAV